MYPRYASDCLSRFLMSRALASVLMATISASLQAGSLHRYWPRFPRPRQVILVPFVGDHQEGMVFETAAGL
ncbi:MAG: hypothetical protein N2512_14555, partial [Armatimonadetes bacterium]|nr:hypothetical protein [Armatimonadota bacterium]